MLNSYRIRKITNQDKQNVLSFIQEYFYTDEPLNRYLNKQRGEEIVCKERGLSFIDAVDEGLSFMAVSEIANKIVGVAINETYKNLQEQHNYDNHPNPIIIYKLLRRLEEECASRMTFKNESEKALSVKLLSVQPKWRNNGIGLELLEHTRRLGVEESFGQISVICTSEYSARAFQRLGFQCMHSIKYEDYEENDKIIFKPDLPHTHVKYMLLNICCKE